MIAAPGATADVQLHLFGGFELRVGGEVVPLQPVGQRLLALLALAPRGVTRAFAAFQLWPDTPERRALANLRSTMWRVNHLCEHLIEAGGQRLRLSGRVWADVREGIEELSQGETAQLAALPFHADLADLLPDWYDDWLTVERERFRHWRLRTLEGRAGDALAAGMTHEALQLALAAAAIDPARDTAHQLVLSAHRADGNEFDVRREEARFARCTDRLLNGTDG